MSDEEKRPKRRSREKTGSGKGRPRGAKTGARWSDEARSRRELAPVRRDSDELARVFVEEFLVDMNWDAACRRMGFRGVNARAFEQRMRRRPDVRKNIEEALEKRSVRLMHEGERVRRELFHIATANISDVVQWGLKKVEVKGRKQEILVLQVADSSKLPREVLAAVKTVRQRVSRDGEVTTEIEMHDKHKALTDLAKHLGLFDRPGGVFGWAQDAKKGETGPPPAAVERTVQILAILQQAGGQQGLAGLLGGMVNGAGNGTVGPAGTAGDLGQGGIGGPAGGGGPAQPDGASGPTG